MAPAIERPEPRLLAGSPIAAEIRAGVKKDVAAFRRRYGYVPTLAIVVVGRDAPSIVYLQQILKSCRSVGLEGRLVEVPGRASTAQVRRQIRLLNEDPLVAGIIVQMPLPKRIPLTAVIDTLEPAKDIDGIHPLNAGLMELGYAGFLPTTAQASVELLKRSGIELEGRRAVVVGRSNVVGKPAAILLLREHATVTVCHSRTRDLPAVCRLADVLVAAVGRAALVGGEHVKPGAVVVDVGVNRVEDAALVERLFPGDEGRRAQLAKRGYTLVGDVDFTAASRVASAITPVPGGIGPLTIAGLLLNTVRAACQRRGLPC